MKRTEKWRLILGKAADEENSVPLDAMQQGINKSDKIINVFSPLSIESTTEALFYSLEIVYLHKTTNDVKNSHTIRNR